MLFNPKLLDPLEVEQGLDFTSIFPFLLNSLYSSVKGLSLVDKEKGKNGYEKKHEVKDKLLELSKDLSPHLLILDYCFEKVLLVFVLRESLSGVVAHYLYSIQSSPHRYHQDGSEKNG